jgi:hypothetical protein
MENRAEALTAAIKRRGTRPLTSRRTRRSSTAHIRDGPEAPDDRSVSIRRLAYTPAGSISNSPEDFGSVIRFVERNFGTMEGALTFVDARGGAGVLTEFFS